MDNFNIKRVASIRDGVRPLEDIPLPIISESQLKFLRQEAHYKTQVTSGGGNWLCMNDPSEIRCDEDDDIDNGLLRLVSDEEYNKYVSKY